MFTLKMLTQAVRHLLYKFNDFAILQLTEVLYAGKLPEITGVISLVRFDTAADNSRYAKGVTNIVTAIRKGKNFKVVIS